MVNQIITSINFEEISENIIKKVNTDIIKINKDGIDFYINLHFKDFSNNLVVFSNGAINRAKKKPPIFMRNTWVEDIKSSCIYVDDPTIHNSRLTIGWGVGISEHYYLESISIIIKKICSVMHINDSNVIYYGSSAGGTMSIMLATLHPGSMAIVNNPQAYTYKYLDGKVVENIRAKFFSSMSISQLLTQYPERFSITECFRKHGHIPKILYVFNGYSPTDYEMQYVPLIEELRTSEFDLSSIQFLIYHDKKLKHGPLPKDKTITLIHNSLSCL